MYRRILIGGVTAAAIVGAGGAALAVTGSGTTAGAPAATVAAAAGSPAGHPLLDRERRILARVAHGQIVVRGKDGGFVTHDVIVGHVTALSSTSITVRAADGTSETFTVNGDTKVRVVGDHVPGLASIDRIAVGDRVAVGGTGASTPTAKHILKLLPR
jgi:hypothetical protein